MDEQRPLDRIFDRLSSGPTLIQDRKVLWHSYVPDELPHREEQITQIGSILATGLKGSRPSNVFVYGKPGTGKTAVTRYVLRELTTKFGELQLPFKAVYLNCRNVDTDYRVLARICAELGQKVPFTGLPTDEVHSRLIELLESQDILTIIVLDEIDRLVLKSGDDTLYKLTRINYELSKASVSLIGISNDLRFPEYLDPRVLSSLSEEKVIFHPYTALQLQDILRRRSSHGLKEGILEEPGVINLCAALAAREEGDARRALDLFRVAVEIAEREGNKMVQVDHVEKARLSIERDTVLEVLRTLPVQQKLVLYAVYLLERHKHPHPVTGEVQDVYGDLCAQLGMDPLTQRRVSDLINDLDAIGVVNAKVVSKGRYGRTKIIRLSVTKTMVADVLERDSRIKTLSSYVPKSLGK
ncbi:MAG: ORC1-type DNA replication protein [Candidatus Thorarchaeota archaeon]